MIMENFIYQNCTPTDEPCIQGGGDTEFQKLEARAMIQQIERTFGPGPEGFYIRINKNYHEAGMYLDLKLYFIEPKDEEESPSLDFAFKLDADWPQKWDEQALEFLHKHRYTTLTCTRNDKSDDDYLKVLP